jgi:citrate lyase subunit beta/citryl-CoA lyase
MMTTHATLPSWLSLLYAPGDQQARIEAAAHQQAHAVIVDLEDFVPPSAKNQARANIEAAATSLSRQGVDAVVRVNRRIDMAVADIDRSVIEPVSALMITKVVGADHLRLLDEWISSLEIRRGLPLGRIKLIALIETAASLERMGEIGMAGSRLVAMGLGGEDIARESAMRSSAETLQYPKQRMIFEAVAAGLIPLGYLASVADYKDADTFRTMALRSRDFGFQAATCLNAGQVGVVNAVYAPTQAEQDRALALIASGGRGLHGQPDGGSLPHEDAADLRHARLVLARAARVANATHR